MPKHSLSPASAEPSRAPQTTPTTLHEPIAAARKAQSTGPNQALSALTISTSPYPASHTLEPRPPLSTCMLKQSLTVYQPCAPSHCHSATVTGWYFPTRRVACRFCHQRTKTRVHAPTRVRLTVPRAVCEQSGSREWGGVSWAMLFLGFGRCYLLSYDGECATWLKNK